MGSGHLCTQQVIHCTTQSPVSLKAIHCVLFVFFNRASRVFHSGSVLVTKMDLSETAILPLLISAALHVAFLCPGMVVPSRTGCIPVLCALIQVLLLHAFALLLVTEALQRYTSTAGFLCVLLSSHLCYTVRPINPNLVPAQNLLYGRVMDSATFILPLLFWILLPVVRVHALEVIALLYIPEVLCTVFAYTLQFTTLLIHVAVDAGCSVAGVGAAVAS